MRKAALTLAILSALSPGGVAALGLGPIEVSSALNEPLQARIALRSLQPGDVTGMAVTLGTADQFARAGVERPFLLSSLKFDVVADRNGREHIRVSSPAPINEPFLNFLIEVNWPRGRVVREYTVLLDPPVYGAAITATARETVRTVDALPSAPDAPAASVAPAAPAPRAGAGGRAPMVSTYTPGGSYGPTTSSDTLWSLAERFRPDAGVSVQSMMLALLRANPDAFAIANVNALREGVVLRLPAESEIRAVDRASALAEVERQHAAWEEYRRNLGLGAPPAPSPAAPAAESAPAAAPPAGGARTAGEVAPQSGARAAASGAAATADGQLKLVGSGGTDGGAPGGAAQPDVTALRNELSLALEDADTRRRENEELSSRLSEAERIIGDLQRLIELKNDEIAALQDQLAKGAEAMPAPAPSGTAPAMPSEMPKLELPKAEAPEPSTLQLPQPEAPAPQAQQPEPAKVEPPKPEAPKPEAAKVEPPKPVPMAPPPKPPSFLETLEDMIGVNPLVAGGGLLGAMLALIGGLAVWRRRRGSSEEVAEESEATFDATPAAAAAGAATAVAATAAAATDDEPTVEVSRVAGEVDNESTLVSEAADTGREEPEDDPLAEVNVYLAYERYQQAEDLIRNAIERYPDRPEYRLRLLEVYHASRNLSGFEVAAKELEDVVGPDHEHMDQARAWWDEMSTGRSLFAGLAGAAAAGAAAAGLAAAADGPSTVEGTSVDFDLGFESGGEGDEGTGAQSGVDFDLSLDAGEAATGSSGLDFDLGSIDEGAEVPDATGTLDFDLSSLGETERPGGASDDAGLDFDLGEAVTRPADADEGGVASSSFIERAAEAGVSSVDLDLASLDTAGQVVGGDSDLEFDLGALGEGAVGDDDTALSTLEGARSPLLDGESAGTDEESLDFDLGDTAPLEDEPAADAASGVDFDLGEALESTAGESSGLDFDLGDTTPFDEETAAPGAASGVDFDLGEAVDATAGESSGLDFDLGDTAPLEEESPAGAGSGLDFDLGEAASEAEEAAAAGSGLDFDLSDTTAFTVDDAARGGEAAESDTGLDFDLGDAEETAASPGESLDFSLDLDMDTPETTSEAGAAGEDDGGLDLDLVLGDEQGGEGGVDFELDGSSESDQSSSALDLDLSGLDEGEPPEEAFDTVKLAADDPSASDDLGLSDELGIDTEFRDIFADADAGEGEADAGELDLDLSAFDEGGEETPTEGPSYETTQYMLRDVPGTGSPGESEDEEHRTLVLGRGAGTEIDEVQTKLDLAQAYIDMEDNESARGVLGEVMAEGNDEQKEQAKSLLAQLT
ncbi:MAG: hypothetical protein H6982_12315 [Chromatiales bacterium]|nr:hypothetical protein [Chromatiales bacterium]